LTIPHVQSTAWGSNLAHTFSLECPGDRLTTRYAEQGMTLISNLVYIFSLECTGDRLTIRYAEHGKGQ
jgi:hypothetical protein